MVTPRERAENLMLRPYKCLICEGLIGMQTDEHLFIGVAVFDLTTTFTCGYCKRKTRWRSGIDTEKNQRKNNGHTN